MRVGIAGTSAALLNASKNCAKQNSNNKTNLRINESRFVGSLASVSTDGAAACADLDIVLKGCERGLAARRV